MKGSNILEKILENLDNPEELEKLYRKSPESFRECFDEAYKENPDSVALEIWKERLFFDESKTKKSKKGIQTKHSDIFLIMALSFFIGTYFRLPIIFENQINIFLYSINAPFFIMLPIIFYLVIKNIPSRKIISYIFILFLITFLFINQLPRGGRSDTSILSYIHMPFFLWSLMGLAFTGNGFREITKRLDYLKWNGEFLVYLPVFGMALMLFSWFSITLFATIRSTEAIEWYFEYITVYGGATILMISISLSRIRNKLGQRIAPIVAKIFSPLFLLILSIYLITVASQGENPFVDRDFLVVFNQMLLIVAAVAIFTFSGRASTNKKTATDYITILLLIVASIVDLVALSAILFRLASYGLTPNRIATLGANILVLINLAGMLHYYLRFIRGTSKVSEIGGWIARYLPVYVIWVAFITFIFPFLFSFK